MEIAKVQPFNREPAKQTAVLPVVRGAEVTYPFQWLLYKPQAHAVIPFETNQPSRNKNVERKSKESD